MRALILISVAGLALLAALHLGLTSPFPGAHWAGLALGVSGIALGLWMSPASQLAAYIIASPSFIGSSFIAAALYASQGPNMIGAALAAGGGVTGLISFLKATSEKSARQNAGTGDSSSDEQPRSEPPVPEQTASQTGHPPS